MSHRYPSLPSTVRRLLTAAALILAPLTSGAQDALAAVYNITYGANFAAASVGNGTTTQQFTGAGSWHKGLPPAAPKFETYIDVASQLGATFKVNEIASLAFHTENNATNPSNIDFYTVIYTTPFGGGDGGSFYGRRLIGETIYANGYVAPTAGVWNTWTTAAGPNQLTFFDSNHCGNAGFSPAPTLADLSAGTIDWATWPGNPTQGASTGGAIDYGNQTVRFLSFQTGSAYTVFEGHLDAVTLTLTNGDIYNIDLEATPDDIYVDDNWVGFPVGTPVGPGQIIGVTAFATVQGGVNAALPGSTVHVAAGSYTEQVNIAKNITVAGAGKGLTVINSPASLTSAFTIGINPNRPIVTAHDASDVRIEDLTVDGNGLGNANYRFIGVAYWRAGGRLLRVNVDEIRETPLSGTQHGVALYVNNDNGGPYALEVADCKLTDFQKNGTVFAGIGLTVNMHGGLVTGAGYTALIAQNGVQLGSGASGSVSSVAISEMGYSPATAAASGVLVISAGGPVSVSSLNGPNAITNVQSPINWYDSNGSMDGIGVSGGADFGPVFVYNSSASLAAGAPRVASARPRPAAAPADDGEIASLNRTPNHIASTYSVDVLNSCLDGTDVAGTAGVGVYTEGGPLSVSARNNAVTDWEVGFTNYGTVAVLSARDNAITSNTSAGYDNTGSSTTQTAEFNWWGAASGPSGDGPGTGDAVLGGNVDFTPFLNNGTNLAAGCGFTPLIFTTTTLSSDLNPSNCGQKVVLTATVSPATATGTVDFLDGGSSIGTGSLVGGVATLSVATLAGGHHPLTASYAGDGGHSPSASALLIQNVHCVNSVTTVEPTPCDSMGWSRANMRLGGSVDMTATYPQSGFGSLEFGTTSSISKADWVRPNGNANLLSTLSALAVDLYRNSSSSSAVHLAPAVRLFVDNGQATDRFSYLIWEPIYNGIPVFPTNTWATYDLFKGNLWQRAFKTAPPNLTIEIFDRTLADWLQPGTVTDGGGNVSNVVGPNARVLAYEIGVGSGWTGTFAGAADNFRIGFAADSVFNFEPRVVTSVSLMADQAASACGGKLVLIATVTPSGVDGVVEFADQAGVAAYYESFETGLGGDPGWDHGVSTFTATRVASGTNGVTSATGGFHAEAVTANGSAFSRWGGYSSVFPPAGYTTMVKVYLDCVLAGGLGDQRVDFTSAINNNTGSHRRDFAFNMGTEATGFVVSAGNNTGRPNANPADPGHDPVHLTVSGWYTLKHRFFNDGGVLACQMSMISPSGAEIIGGPAWKRSDPSDVMSLIGGNRYGWFANQEMAFLAFDDATLTKSSVGSAPVVGGVATLSVTTLQPGSHTFVATFVPTDCATGSSSGKLAHQVNQGPSTVTLAASPNPAKSAGDSVSITATVSPSVGTGTVEFFDGATSLGTAPVVGGVATIALKFAVEGDHSLTANYSGDACLLPGSATKIILTVGSAPSISIADLSSTESNSGTKVFKFLVTLSSAINQAVTVNYQTSDGTATLANNDYVATSGTVTIRAGALTDTARVSVRGDTNRESDETFNVTLSNPTKATLADGSAVGTILNDDSVPQILHTGVRLAEGHPGLTNILMTVSLSNPSDLPVSVNWATSDSNATLANNDYIQSSGSVTIPAKASSATFTVQAVGDSTNEDWEVFHVDLSSPVNATLSARPWLRVELTNDDTAPMVYIDDVQKFEGDAGTTAFVFRVRLSRATAIGTPTVSYTTQNGTATLANNDYQATSGSVTFGVKEREQFITVLVNGDTQFEADETFTVRLSNPRFGMGPIGDGLAIGTILNDDPKLCPTVTAIAPDKNDLVVTGGIAKLSWSAVPGDNPITTIDLYISRDNRATFQPLVVGEANDGTYLWNPVTGPGTNSGPVPVFNCWLRVVAHDAAGCAVSDSSGPFSIYDVVTDALMAQFHAVAAGNGVEVRWELSAGLQVSGVDLERSRNTEGPWEVITAERRTEGATVVALDRSAAMGTTYYYRLALNLEDGGQVRVGPLEVEAGTAITAFALGKISPNPSRGMTRIDYELPREASVRVSVMDVAGREVAVLASGNKGAGRYQAVWSGETDRGRAPAGLYFIRYQAPGIKLVRRLVLAR